jgi:hypothetical protein
MVVVVAEGLVCLVKVVQALEDLSLIKVEEEGQGEAMVEVMDNAVVVSDLVMSVWDRDVQAILQILPELVDRMLPMDNMLVQEDPAAAHLEVVAAHVKAETTLEQGADLVGKIIFL